MSHDAFRGSEVTVAPRPDSPKPVLESPTVMESPQNSGSSNGYGPGPVIDQEMSYFIPETHRARTLVLCFDGTGDQFDADNSNIVELFKLLRKDNVSEQMVYYQAGIGTYTTPEIATPMASKVSKTLDMMVAWNLHAHVMGGYEFLMQNYNAGDAICIFGFSRGAYTARSLAGMVHKIGILPPCNHQQVPFAYRMYMDDSEKGWLQSNTFKKCFTVDADIEFLGVWDTVSSVGLIPRTLPFTGSNTIVRTFRHAVALDERRAKFHPQLWKKPTEKERSRGLQSNHMHKANGGYKVKHVLNQDHKQKQYERQFSMLSDKEMKDTDVEEVWFTGCHCDIGGGSVENGVPNSLARIPLRWMIRECFKTDSGIMFDSEGLREVGLDPACLYPVVKDRPAPLSAKDRKIQDIPPPVASPVPSTIPTHYADGCDDHHEPSLLQDELAEQQRFKTYLCKSEEEHELLDCLSPIYDQLSIAKYWWALEVMPMPGKQRRERRNESWAAYFGLNLGRGRDLPKPKETNKVKIHRSVKMRMEASHENGTKYTPLPKFSEEYVEWVD